MATATAASTISRPNRRTAKLTTSYAAELIGRGKAKMTTNSAAADRHPLQLLPLVTE